MKLLVSILAWAVVVSPCSSIDKTPKSERIVGIVDIMEKISDWDKHTGMCPVAPSKKKEIQTVSENYGKENSFKISFSNLPEMLPFKHCYGFAKVFEESGRQVRVKKGSDYGWIKSSDYLRYIPYPDLLKGRGTKNISVTNLYQLHKNVFKKDPLVIQEANSLVYAGSIEFSGELWIRVQVYDRSFCHGEQKLIKEGWVKGYKGDKPTLWVYAKGC